MIALITDPFTSFIYRMYCFVLQWFLERNLSVFVALTKTDNILLSLFQAIERTKEIPK